MQNVDEKCNQNNKHPGIATYRGAFDMLFQIFLDLGGADFRRAGQINDFDTFFFQKVKFARPIVSHDKGVICDHTFRRESHHLDKIGKRGICINYLCKVVGFLFFNRGKQHIISIIMG